MKSQKTPKQAGKDNREFDKIASEFISFVAHQIKSPLTAIKGYADLVAEGHYGKISHEAHDIIVKIKAAAERALDLSHNLLDLRSIEEGKMRYSFEPADVNQIVKGVCDELKPLADQKRIDLIFSPSKGETTAKVDKKAIHQVIQNLVDNAVKYTSKGWVKVSVGHEANGIVVKVADSGRGMSKKILKIAFEKFTRDEGVYQAIRGTGLGLFIARNIVSDHKGKIWAESEGEGKGSTFFISLKK